MDSAVGQATRDVGRPDDRALALAIASEALRWMVDLDALIDRATQRPLPVDSRARLALRVALVQPLRLGTPAHAAIATTLPLVEGSPRRLVHGIFSTVTREGWTLPDRPTLPPGVAKRWRAAWGEAEVAAASSLLAEPPPLDIAFDSSRRPARLDGVSLAPGHLRLARGRAVTDLAGFEEGAWWVQDIAASMPARLLGAGQGRRVLDLCAAPGGKTMQLAAAGWRVTALDVSESRLARLSDNLARTGLEAQIVVADLLEWEAGETFDAILLDAPCSATGTFRRHPDVLHRFRAGALADLAATQKAMLARASGWLAEDGALVYSVCSLESEEGENVARDFLASENGWSLTESRRLLPSAFLADGGADCFFMARFDRKRG